MLSSVLPASRSPSLSPDSQALGGVPPGSSSRARLDTTTGDRRFDVQRLFLRRTMMRNLKRAVLRLPSARPAAAGTITTSLRELDRFGLAKAVRRPGPRKMTVFRRRFELKRLPRMVSFPPTGSLIGVTRVIDGRLLFFFAKAPAGMASPTSAI